MLEVSQSTLPQARLGPASGVFAQAPGHPLRRDAVDVGGLPILRALGQIRRVLRPAPWPDARTGTVSRGPRAGGAPRRRSSSSRSQPTAAPWPRAWPPDRRPGTEAARAAGPGKRSRPVAPCGPRDRATRSHRGPGRWRTTARALGRQLPAATPAPWLARPRAGGRGAQGLCRSPGRRIWRTTPTPARSPCACPGTCSGSYTCPADRPHRAAGRPTPKAPRSPLPSLLARAACALQSPDPAPSAGAARSRAGPASPDESARPLELRCTVLPRDLAPRVASVTPRRLRPRRGAVL